MESSDGAEHPTQSFIVRIWIEEPAEPRRGATWRGHITHVQSGRRRPVDSLAGIHRFIVGHLAAVGVRPGVVDRIRLTFVKAWDR